MVTPPPILLDNISMADSFILMVLALVVFGPRRLPQIGRQIGKLMYEFRKASNDFKFQMEEELRVAEEADRRKKEEEERQRVAALAATSQASVSAPAQTVEAAADIGAVEPPAASSEAYSPEAPPPSAEPAPTIQPPRTGEQVSASRPEYHYGSSGNSAPESAAVAEVNPDADTDANAAGFEAQAAAHSDPARDAGTAVAQTNSPVTDSTSPTPAGAPKETVSQHG